MTEETKPDVTRRTETELRKAVLTVGLYTMICFILRYIARIVITSTDAALEGTVPYNVTFMLFYLISALFLQILPCIIGVYMFGYVGKKADKSLKALYRKPKRMARALGNTAAVYGGSQAANLLTILAIFLFASKVDFDKVVNSALDELPNDMPTAFFLFFVLIVIAPVFEELMFRGFVLNALKPYGHGFAIITSGLLFGLFHGNFRQFFYTAVFGIALGYIADVSDSILPTMIIHAIVNGISGVMLILMSTSGVQEYITHRNSDAIPDAEMISVAAYGIYMVCLIIFIIVGVIAFVSKLRGLKRYKLPRVCAEIPNSKKVCMLLFNIPAVLGIIMIADTFMGFSRGLIAGIFGKN